MDLLAVQVSCMHADEANNILWLGHMDGRVSGFVLGPTPGSPINSQLIHQWQVCQAYLQSWNFEEKASPEETSLISDLPCI